MTLGLAVMALLATVSLGVAGMVCYVVYIALHGAHPRERSDILRALAVMFGAIFRRYK